MKKDLLLSASRLSWSAPVQHGSKWDKSKITLKFRNDVLLRDKYTCQTCGWFDKEFLEIHHINDDHSNFKMSNLEAICPLCHMVHHPSLASLSGAGHLIWLPEMSQIQLNLLMFHIISIERAGSSHPWNNVAKAINGLFEVRRVFFENQIGKSDPAILGQIILNMSEEDYKEKKESLKPIKLLALPARYEIESDYWLAKINSDHPNDSLMAWAAKLNQE